MSEKRLAELAAPRAVEPAKQLEWDSLRRCYHKCSICGNPRKGGRCATCTIDREAKTLLVIRSRKNIFWGDGKGIVVDDGRRLTAFESRRNAKQESLRLSLSSTAYYI